MGEFVRVAKVAEIPDGGKQVVEVDERLIVICHVGGSFYAIDDVCTHDGGPLGDGASGWIPDRLPAAWGRGLMFATAGR